MAHALHNIILHICIICARGASFAMCCILFCPGDCECKRNASNAIECATGTLHVTAHKFSSIFLHIIATSTYVRYISPPPPPPHIKLIIMHRTTIKKPLHAPFKPAGCQHKPPLKYLVATCCVYAVVSPPHFYCVLIARLKL